jgi:hypothetical protein
VSKHKRKHEEGKVLTQTRTTQNDLNHEGNRKKAVFVKRTIVVEHLRCVFSFAFVQQLSRWISSKIQVQRLTTNPSHRCLLGQQTAHSGKPTRILCLTHELIDSIGKSLEGAKEKTNVSHKLWDFQVNTGLANREDETYCWIYRL